LSSDTLVEDVHFRTKWVNFEQLGWKTGAVVLSDFAAMGKVTPHYLLVNLGLPSNFSFLQVKRFYSGIEKISRRWRIVIAGGDTVRAKKFFSAIFLLGETEKNNFISRRGANPGDLIFSTGPLGEAAAGLSLLERSKNHKGYTQKNTFYQELVKKHLLPQPRIREGRILAEKKLATSLIDCSDGLERSVRLLACANNLEAEIYLEKLPLTANLKKYLDIIRGRQSSKDLLRAFRQLALFGGEDYELIFTAEEKNYQKIRKYIPSAFTLGKLSKKKKVISKEIKFLHFGKIVKLEGKSYDAFLS
jgi:thiamine-monophosphate kinase